MALPFGRFECIVFLIYVGRMPLINQFELLIDRLLWQRLGNQYNNTSAHILPAVFEAVNVMFHCFDGVGFYWSQCRLHLIPVRRRVRACPEVCFAVLEWNGAEILAAESHQGCRSICAMNELRLAQVNCFSFLSFFSFFFNPLSLIPPHLQNCCSHAPLSPCSILGI